MRNLGNLGNLEGTLGTFTWEPGNLYLGPWEPLLGNLGTFTWDPGNLYLGTWEPLLGNLYLGPWEPLLGNLYLGTWEPLLGNLDLEPGNLGGMGFGAAPVCSETFTMAEDPKAFCCWGKKRFTFIHFLVLLCSDKAPWIFTTDTGRNASL